jgi:hypothetical protein
MISVNQNISLPLSASLVALKLGLALYEIELVYRSWVFPNKEKGNSRKMSNIAYCVPS